MSVQFVVVSVTSDVHGLGILSICSNTVENATLESPETVTTIYCI